MKQVGGREASARFLFSCSEIEKGPSDRRAKTGLPAAIKRYFCIMDILTKRIKHLLRIFAAGGSVACAVARGRNQSG
jgi:hypothetical protein